MRTGQWYLCTILFSGIYIRKKLCSGTRNNNLHLQLSKCGLIHRTTLSLRVMESTSLW